MNSTMVDQEVRTEKETSARGELESLVLGWAKESGLIDLAEATNIEKLLWHLEEVGKIVSDSVTQTSLPSGAKLLVSHLTSMSQSVVADLTNNQIRQHSIDLTNVGVGLNTLISSLEKIVREQANSQVEQPKELLRDLELSMVAMRAFVDDERRKLRTEIELERASIAEEREVVTKLLEEAKTPTEVVSRTEEVRVEVKPDYRQLLSELDVIDAHYQANKDRK